MSVGRCVRALSEGAGEQGETTFGQHYAENAFNEQMLGSPCRNKLIGNRTVSQRIMAERRMAPCFVSHAPGQHEQQVLDARLAILYREQGQLAMRPHTAQPTTHLEFLHFFLELVDGQMPDFFYKTFHFLHRGLSHSRRRERN